MSDHLVVIQEPQTPGAFHDLAWACPRADLCDSFSGRRPRSMLQGRWRFEGVDYFFAYPVSRDSGFATFQPMSQFGLYTCNETLRFWDDGEYPEIAEKHNHTVLCFVAEISRALRRLSPPEEIFAAACAQRRSEFEN